jgi:hypothetical protein
MYLFPPPPFFFSLRRHACSVCDHYFFFVLCTVDFDEGLLSQEVSSEEPMKLALCALLQHLCDCQVSSACLSFGKLGSTQQNIWKPSRFYFY